ncbi:MAG: nitrite reductase [Burkholderiaceae bacterium]|nr:nitrite reductase [Burkholderiaceae bacterium]
MNCKRAMAALLIIVATPTVSQTFDVDRAERVFAQHCAVCHGADRGGYLAPALNRDETKLSPAIIEQKIAGGAPPTLIPAHPSSWRGGISAKDRKLLVALVTTQPKATSSWSLEDVRKSLEVFVADESRLATAPGYRIDRIDDLMAVMSRGRRAAGVQAKVSFYDGRTHRKIGEVATVYAPHLMDFHPTQPRWAYVRDDAGYVHKVDLYSMKVVRKVRAGLNGISLAVSRDGRYVAAGSYVPNTMVILDADTLEPVRLLELEGVDPDGKMVQSDAGIITATPFASIFVVALEQAGRVWIVDLERPGMPVTTITGVGRHLHDGFLSPDGRYLVVSSYEDHHNAVIDLAQARIVRKIPSGCKPHLGSGAVVQSNARLVGIGTNIREENCESYEVTVFDMGTFEVLKRIPVIGPTESPAAHPPVDVPAGVFSRSRARTVVVGLQEQAHQ